MMLNSHPSYLLTLSGKLLLSHLTDGETEAWREEVSAHYDNVCKQLGRDSSRVLFDASHAPSGGVWLTRLNRDVLVFST